MHFISINTKVTMPRSSSIIDSIINLSFTTTMAIIIILLLIIIISIIIIIIKRTSTYLHESMNGFGCPMLST